MAQLCDMCHEDERSQGFGTACLALLALLYGHVLLVVCYIAWSSEAIDTVDSLVRFDLNFGPDTFLPTTKTIFWGLMVVGALVALVAAMGIAAAATRSKGFTSAYVLLSSILAVVMLIAGIEALERRQTVDPIIRGQVEDLCNGTTYIRLTMNLGCPWTSKFNVTTPVCNEFCMDRVTRLRALDGCTLLPLLCERFMYEDAGVSQCAASLGQLTTPLYVAAFGMAGFDGDSESCAAACDADIMCDSYFYGRATDGTIKCALTSALPATHQPPEWTALAPADATAYFSGEPMCWQRTKSRVLEQFEKYDFRVSMVTIVLAFALGISSCGSCLHMYNINVRREGKPNACSLCYMMLCPCFAGDYKRFTLGDDSDHEDPPLVNSREIEFASGHAMPAPAAAAPSVGGGGQYAMPYAQARY
eukprot:TRINITY_DN31372_c0_g1_i1.p1 TRINITY_DN31372_c0_g1~~TRINITY_DN31372_c0_g1_i1.p1  ORF type:complete len:443 (+),score=72.61 TRINITY_DN31372_c0_g1_i1:80-1330(+)